MKFIKEDKMTFVKYYHDCQIEFGLSHFRVPNLDIYSHHSASVLCTVRTNISFVGNSSVQYQLVSSLGIPNSSVSKDALCIIYSKIMSPPPKSISSGSAVSWGIGRDNTFPALVTKYSLICPSKVPDTYRGCAINY